MLFLGDIFPTGWQAAVQCDIEPTDTVAIWGCGPVGQMAIRSAVLLGAKQVIAIDRLPERLGMAEAGGAITINFEEESVVERLNDLTDGKGPEKCIDCDRHGKPRVASSKPDTIYDRAKQMMMLESDRPHVLREMIYVCRPAGMISIPGVYGGLVDKIPLGCDEQGPDLPHRARPTSTAGPTTCCAGSRRARSIRPSSSPTPSVSRMDPRCTRCSATSRTAASRSC